MVNKYTYLEIFIDDLNKQINLQEFEEYYNLPHQTIKRQISFLIKNKILIEEKKKKFRFYKLNLKNLLIYDYILMCEKERLFKFLENPLFKRLYEQISKYFNDNKFLIFGSSVNKNNYNDIDILIIGKNLEVRKTLKEFNNTYNVKFHIIQTEKITETLKEEIKKKHIFFNEYDYFVKLLYKK